MQNCSFKNKPQMLDVPGFIEISINTGMTVNRARIQKNVYYFLPYKSASP